jgi:hypothetical protein
MVDGNSNYRQRRHLLDGWMATATADGTAMAGLFDGNFRRFWMPCSSFYGVSYNVRIRSVTFAVNNVMRVKYCVVSTRAFVWRRISVLVMAGLQVVTAPRDL